MIKKIAWEAFKNTANINTYLELKQIENIEEKIEKNDLNIENLKNDAKPINKTNEHTKENFEGKEEL